MSNIGVFPFRLDTELQIKVIKDLLCHFTRDTLTLTEWNGKTKPLSFQKFEDANIEVLLNIQWMRQSQLSMFATDMNLLSEKVRLLLKLVKPRVLVYGNEPTNKNFSKGTMSQYILGLKTVAKIAREEYDVKVSDGGLHPMGVCYYAWKDLKEQGRDDDAKMFMNNTFNSAMRFYALYNQAPNSPYGEYLKKVDELLNGYSESEITHVNIHIYEPINKVGTGVNANASSYQIMADYLRKRTGKRVLTNEIGQWNTNSQIVAQMLDAITSANIRYGIWFSGDAINEEGKAVALNNLDGSLRSNGEVFKKWMQENNTL